MAQSPQLWLGSDRYTPWEADLEVAEKVAGETAEAKEVGERVAEPVVDSVQVMAGVERAAEARARVERAAVGVSQKRWRPEGDCFRCFRLQRTAADW